MTSTEPVDHAVDADQAAIADIVRIFFAAFTSGPDSPARLDALREAFLPGAIIVRGGGSEPTVYGVDSFIAPRQALLSGGTLVDFSEWHVSGRTEVFGDIAAHFGSYAKAGVQDGMPFTGRGMKSLQFVRTSAGWRISAAAWDDEREGLSSGAKSAHSEYQLKDAGVPPENYGAVIYTTDVDRIAAFYGGLGGVRPVHGQGYATIDLTEFEIVVVMVPDGIAATITVTDPPKRRTGTPLKLALPVASIAAARAAAPALGGIVDPSDREWRFESTLVCDGHDPDGNVFQLREVPRI